MKKIILLVTLVALLVGGVVYAKHIEQNGFLVKHGKARPVFVVNEDPIKVQNSTNVVNTFFDNRCDLTVGEVSLSLDTSNNATLILFPIHPEFILAERTHRFFEFEIENSLDGVNWFAVSRTDTSYSKLNPDGTPRKRASVIPVTASQYRLRIVNVPQDINGVVLGDCLTVNEYLMSTAVQG